jgi:hypothetical protein
MAENDEQDSVNEHDLPDVGEDELTLPDGVTPADGDAEYEDPAILEAETELALKRQAEVERLNGLSDKDFAVYLDTQDQFKAEGSPEPVEPVEGELSEADADFLLSEQPSETDFKKMFLDERQSREVAEYKAFMEEKQAAMDARRADLRAKYADPMPVEEADVEPPNVFAAMSDQQFRAFLEARDIGRMEVGIPDEELRATFHRLNADRLRWEDEP